MRAAIVGAFFHDRPRERETFGRALAEVTHRDDRAIEGALYVAEMVAACVPHPERTSPSACQEEARKVVRHAELGAAIDRALELERGGASLREAAEACGTTGYVVSTVAFATFCFLRHGDDPMRALSGAIGAGGDTDSIGAILGAWLGALHGEAGLPGDLIGRIHDGPFGPTHLRALAACLARSGRASRAPCPRIRRRRRWRGTWRCTRWSWATGSGGSCPSDPRPGRPGLDRSLDARHSAWSGRSTWRISGSCSRLRWGSKSCPRSRRLGE